MRNFVQTAPTPLMSAQSTIVAPVCALNACDSYAQSFLQEHTVSGDPLVARHVDGPLPEDPDAPAWGSCEPFGLPLMGQYLRAPRWQAPAVDYLRVCALYDEREIAVRIEWNDPFRDDRAGAKPQPEGETPEPDPAAAAGPDVGSAYFTIAQANARVKQRFIPDAGDSGDAAVPDAGDGRDAGVPDAGGSGDAGVPDAGPCTVGARVCVDAATAGYCDSAGTPIADRSCPGSSACVGGHCAPPTGAPTCVNMRGCVAPAVCDLYVVAGVLVGYCTEPVGSGGVYARCGPAGESTACESGFCAIDGADSAHVQCLELCRPRTDGDCGPPGGSCHPVGSPMSIEGVSTTGQWACFR